MTEINTDPSVSPEDDYRRHLRTVVRATGLITAAMFIGKVAGLARELSLARLLGTTRLTDVFVLSFVVPDFFTSVLYAGGITAACLPLLKRAEADGGGPLFRTRARELLIVGAALGLTVSLLLSWGAPRIVDVLAPRFESEARSIAIAMLRVTAFVTVVHTTSGVMGDILFARGQFALPALGTLIFNSTVIVALVTYVVVPDPMVLAGGLLAAAVVRLLSMGPLTHRWVAGDAPAWSWAQVASTAKTFLRIATPAILAFAVFHLNTIINQWYALRLQPGSAAALNYSVRLVEVPLSVVSSAISIAIFPALSALIAAASVEEAHRLTRSGLALAGAVTLPVLALFLYAPQSVVDLVYSGGRFDAVSSQVTSSCVRTLAVSIPFAAIAALVTRAFYATQNTVPPLVAAVASVVVNVVLQSHLADRYGVSGVGAAASVAAAANALLLVLIARRHGLMDRLARSDGAEFARIGLASGAAVAVFAALGALGSSVGLGSRLATAGALAFAGLAYVGLHRLFKSQNWRLVTHAISRADSPYD